MKKYLLIGIALLLTACSSDVASNEMETITDNITIPKVEFIESSANTFEIEYGHQNMDRGNYDFISLRGKQKTVVEKTKEFKRGDVIYFNFPEDYNQLANRPDDYLGRVVGLPGETVEIIDGQVFIDNQKLDAFYARATYLGWDLDKYRENGFNKNTLTEEEFKEDMAPIKIKDTEVFVLSDDWIRSVGSQDFGPIEIVAIKGKVLGYKK